MTPPVFSVRNREQRKLVVGVGAMEVSNDSGIVLATYALGSCLAVAIYDPISRSGGLLHALLPESALDAARAAERPALFVDTGLPALFRAAYELSAAKHRVQICVAGAASFMDEGERFNIGRRNYACCANILRRHGLTARAERVGGTVSRTLFLDLATGDVRLSATGQAAETFYSRS